MFGRRPSRDQIPTAPEPPAAPTVQPVEPARKSFYLGGYRALTSLYTGHKIFVDTRDVGIAPHLLWEGRWEPWIDGHVVDAVKPGMVVCDVGANFGYYTLLMAEKVGQSGHVHAFEPNPRVANLLRQSVAVNGFASRTTVHELALGDTEAELSLHVDEASMGGGYVTIEPTGLPVRCRRLDDVLGADARIDFLKVDVEGAEDAVLRGAEQILGGASLQGALIEIARGIASSEPPAAMRPFLEKGMSATALEPQGPVPIVGGAWPEALAAGTLFNILFHAT